MAEYTETLGLKKPAQEDFYNIDEYNSNADIIDEAIAELLQIVDNLAKQIEAAAYIIDENGNKYRWGKDESGVYLEEVTE